MAKLMTLAEAAARFAPLVTTGISIELAIQEAVDRIYEMGRWPGSTEEVEIGTDEFVFDANANVYHVHFDAATYDGAIGFRDDSRGWSVVDHVVLYKDGINAGDLEFVDCGLAVVDDVSVRKYRCPQGFVPDAGPYYALLKLDPPQLAHDDVIPIESVGGLRAAIVAVSYEYVNDEERANLSWAKFDQLMRLSERQFSGPKKYFIGMDCSLRRKPQQFQ